MRDMKILNFEASTLYWLNKDEEKITERERLIADKKAGQTIDEQRLSQLGREIYSFSGINHVITQDNFWKFLRGTVADSLMSRKLRSISRNGKDDIITDKSDSYDICFMVVNLTFKNDVMIQDGSKMVKVFDPETEDFIETDRKKMKKLISRKKLRKMAYEDGIIINGVKYVDFQRSSSKARTGNDLFIAEEYLREMDEWQKMGMPFDDMETDLVSIRAYESLVSSSIIGTVAIDPENILLIDDVKSEYEMPCNVVKMTATVDSDGNPIKSSHKHLKVVREPYPQATDLWDGQSLLDSSVFAGNGYGDKGFLLLRNRFFKSAGFNTRLQDYYRENGITAVTDMFGNEIPAENVLMVTTPNSVKIFKFADVICNMIPEEKKATLLEVEKVMEQLKSNKEEVKKQITATKRKRTMRGEENTSDLTEQISALEEQLKSLDEEIKTAEKPVKREKRKLTWNWYKEQIAGDPFGVCKYEKQSKFGDKQQLWYQVVGSLNLTEDDLRELVDNQITEVNLIKKNVAWFKHFIGQSGDFKTADDMMLTLLDKNDAFSHTKWYKDYRRSRIQGILDKIKMGKIQIPGSDFRVLFGNPYEMLFSSSGQEITDSIIHDFECYCPAFGDGEELFGFRSPHICTGNSALLTNVYRPEWKWFNLTDNIIAVNFWGKGAFLSPVWNGADTDSDTAYIGNNKIILDKVREAVLSGNFPIPINGEEPEAKIVKYGKDALANTDTQLCNDYIGRVCNLGRDLQAFFWHIYNSGTERQKKYLPDIYDDICICEVLSNIAIDSAKRRYNLNIAQEISHIKTRPYLRMDGAIIVNENILITGDKRYKKSVSDETIEKVRALQEKREQAETEEELAEINQEIENELKVVDQKFVRPAFTKKLQGNLPGQKRKSLSLEEKILMSKMYKVLDCSMDLLQKIVPDMTERAGRSKDLPIVAVLNDYKGVKPDDYRVRTIKKKVLEGKKQLDTLRARYRNDMSYSYEEFIRERDALIDNIVDRLRTNDGNNTPLKIGEADIVKLIMKVYGQKKLRDKNGHEVKDEKGKVMYTDPGTDAELKKEKAGMLMLQWVYQAFPEEFGKVFADNKGKSSRVVEVSEPGENVTEYDGRYYKIETVELKQS